MKPRRTSFTGFLVVFAAVAGCATKDPAPTAIQTRDGIAEYRQLAVDAEKAIASALGTLARVEAQTNRCPPKLFKEFSTEIERLQVDSLRIRARAQAIQQRGDEYFAAWHEHLANVKDSQVRKLAEERRPALELGFAKIKLTSQQTRSVFNPFLSGLRRLRSAMENDPESLSSPATRTLIKQTQAGGRQVQQNLTVIKDELSSLAALVKPLRAAKVN